MFARAACLAALLVAGCTSRPVPAPSPTASPGKALATACAGRNGWSDPAPPAKIFGNTYYVGTCGITVLLIDAPGGLVLIDGATEAATPSILANIRALGFDPKDVHTLLATHEHDDHVGGLSALQQATGARVYARREAAAALSSGHPDDADPQRGTASPFKGVIVSATVGDGDVLPIGDLGLTAHATPGHTPGSTSWTWRSCEGRDCRAIAYVDSVTALTDGTYRFSENPAYVATFRTTLNKVAAFPCDILISPHPPASNLFARLSGEAPLADTNACRAYAEAAAKRLDDLLAKEKAAR